MTRPNSPTGARAPASTLRLGAALIACALAGPPASAASLLPHRAAYDLTRHAGSTDRQVSSVTGRLEVVFEASCDGWRIEQALGFRLFGEQGVVAEHAASLAGWESRDGRHYWFNTSNYEGRSLVEEIAGFARSGEGAAGTVNFSKPHAQERPLPPGTLFPTGHIAALIEAAQSGERNFSRPVFDGSTLEAPYEISAFFGPARTLEPAGARPGGRAWPVRLAYFTFGASSPAPAFEMSVLLFDNGVAGDMIYDYGDLKIDVTLTELELRAMPACQ